MISKISLAFFAIIVAVSLITASGVAGTALAKKSGDTKACEKRAASKDHHLAGYEKRECAHNPNAFKHGH
ncbi:MAG TPA: hypothetical protein VJ729_00070 [Nitrososphaeraceae archaeon]|nr:hypothetical protein [Nitrososphaeraceae archaeon]